MIRFSIRSVLLLAIAVAVPAPGFAQGTQYGTVRGAVTLQDGTPAGGVLVTAVSPAQPGERTALTTATGEYILRNLLPGDYIVVFELEGLNPHQSPATVSLGQITPVDVTMEPAVVEGETIHVTGERPSVLANSEVSTTYTAEDVDKLPIGRTPADIANLAPGLTDNTPNDDQVTISGAFAYDNIFLIDGVDANDNLFGDVNFVYIEDAIADTQVLTSGISAEYGRFSGGVINIVTKSGGNEFSGSFRADLTNEDWREKTPVEEADGVDLIDDTNEIYSATLGGYVLKDQLWFFGAARDEETSEQDTLAQTGIPVVESVTEERYELKGTWNIGNRHQVQGQYTDRDAEGVRPSFDFSATLNTLRSRRDPNWLRVARYNGALTNSLFAEAQWSEKHFGFRNMHGDEGLVESSPFFALLGQTPDGRIINTPNLHFHAPYFDGTDPEDRDNEQIYGAASWFADSASLGSHDLKAGYEDFTSSRVGGNSQSPTNFVWDTVALIDDNGDYIVDADGDFIPVFVPGVTYVELWIPNRGATIDIQTRSLYANDRWRLNDHWSFNLGVRYEDVTSDATGGIVTVDTDRLVPRLGASYDLRGDGKYRFDATYAQYSGKYSESQFAENTTVGVPRGVFLDYVGPECTGFDCAEAFDIENNYVPFDANDGTANIIMAGDISSPVVTEYTLAGGTELPRGGYLKAIYTNREYDDFVEDFTCTADAGVPCPGPGDTGTTFVVVEGVPVGFVNNEVFDNSSNPSREYEAIQLIGRYVLTDRWDVNGHWTYQIANEGNFEGEGTNQPGISSFFGDYPGYFVADRHFPTGRLNDYEEHKIRLWSTYNFDLGRAGSLATTLLANYDSGTTYSLQGALPRGFTTTQQEILEAYDSAPAPTQLVFFGERGSGDFASATYFDLGLLYSLPVITRWGLQVFLKADVFNVFNEDKAIQWNTDVAVDQNSPVDANGLPTGFTPGAAFGDPEDNDDFLAPREYQFGVGIRF